MIAHERLARLESLLARVQARSGALAAPAAGSSVEASPAPVARPVAHVEPPPSTPASQPPVFPSEQSEPPPTEAELDGDMDVEVTSEVVEVDIDIDDPALAADGFPRESGAQPVGELRSPVEPVEIEENAEELAGDGSILPPANEVIEPAPSSSPRVITPAVYDEESSARHTPPPESGKQVAVASVKPEARKSSAPPPASDGHTLMGGWREPGMPLGRGEARPGVRVPPPPPPPPAERPAAASTPGSATPSLPLAPMAADATAPTFPPAAQVARVEGSVVTFVPSTFGELLDASLAI